jgi:uncharacterized lipoprotein YddW (UPF0748 family)
MSNCLRFTILALASMTCGTFAAGAEPAATAEDSMPSRKPIVLDDFTQLTPPGQVSPTPASGKWLLGDMGGQTVLYADGGTALEPVDYPLDLNGWYDIHVGLVEKPGPIDDAEWQGIHLKLTDDPWYTHVSGGRTGLGTDPSLAVVDEMFWKRANLTDQDIRIYQPYGRFFKPAGGIAYLKLVPVSDEQVEADRLRLDALLQSDEPKEIGGMADWWSLMFALGSVEPDATRQMVQRHKEAGFNTLYMQINADGVVHYPSKVAQTVYYHPDEDPRPEAKIIGQFLSKHDPLKVAVEESRKQGVKLFAWFRMTNEQHPDSPHNEYSVKFRNQRIIGADGQPTRWPSLAYPEVQEFKLAILKEIVTGYEVDGLLLDYLRTMPAIGYEPNVVQAYVKAYGIDPLKNPKERSAIRWKKFRAAYLTRFMRDIRKMVDAEQERSGRKIRIATRVTPQDNLWKGMDVERWIKDGLVDTVIVGNYTWFDPFISIKPFVEMAQGTDVKVYPAVNPFFAGGDDYGEHHPDARQKDVAEIIRRRMSESPTPTEYAERAVQHYADGAEGVVFYESESLTADPPLYPSKPGMIEMFKTLSAPNKLREYVETHKP